MRDATKNELLFELSWFYQMYSDGGDHFHIHHDDLDEVGRAKLQRLLNLIPTTQWGLSDKGVYINYKS